MKFRPSMPKPLAAANRMPVIRPRFGGSGQVYGVGGWQKDGCLELLEDVSNSRHSLLILREPLETSEPDVRPLPGPTTHRFVKFTDGDLEWRLSRNCSGF